MTIHESNVNFRNLIRDLTEMYTYDVAEVVLIELVANALDAKSNRISIFFDQVKRVLTIEDNGTGMNLDQFKKYHDLAAGLKSRGSGIGFAGVGAKISFNIADKVMTETRSKSFEGGSNWHLFKNDDGIEQLIWEEIDIKQLVGQGTRIEVYFSEGSEIPFSSTNDIVTILIQHYLPLFDINFLKLYHKLQLYEDLKFFVNGIEIIPKNFCLEFKCEKVKEVFLEQPRLMIGYGVMGLSEMDYPTGDNYCGVLISVYGKVVKSELFNQFPGREGAKIFGVFEVPGLINFLNTSKLDFIHAKGKHKDFERYYGPIRESFKQWLIEVGIQSQELDVNEESRKLEKEISKILEDIPELSEFFGFRSKKNVYAKLGDGIEPVSEINGVQDTFPDGSGSVINENGVPDSGLSNGTSIVPDPKSDNKANPISRSSRKGPKIAFVNAVERLELSWVEGNTISINTGHPGFMKLKGNFKEKRVLYLVAIACAVQRYLFSQQNEKPDLLFIDRLMSAWGNK